MNVWYKQHGSHGVSFVVMYVTLRKFSTCKEMQFESTLNYREVTNQQY